MKRDRLGVSHEQPSIQNSMFRAERADEIAAHEKWREDVAKMEQHRRARLKRMRPLDVCIRLSTSMHERLLRAVAEAGTVTRIPWSPAVQDCQDWGCFTEHHGGELTVRGHALLTMLVLPCR